MEEVGTQPEPQLEAQPEKVFLSPAGSPLAVGEPGDTILSPEEVLEIDRILCVPNKDYERSIALFNSRPDILNPCRPLPLSSSNEMNHKYPCFKPENIEWSLGSIPYPKLNLYVQRAIDVKDDVGLVDLIDGQNLATEWGEENLDHEGTTDTHWLEEYYQLLCAECRAEGKPVEFVFLDPNPSPRRKMWDFLVKNENKRRLGWKYSSERYATRYRKHGSVDPRTRVRPGL
ncbi:uncharacterized protein BDV14DRAFT_189011 [Aspergillus stella-maris]|uniref:uncharacterized protein n=1 Tax=Aspergillus stella-maris TaxID=1810926 RepID=UPI003CCE4B35